MSIPPKTAWWCSECQRKFVEHHPRTVHPLGDFGRWVCSDCALKLELGYLPAEKPPGPEPLPLQGERLFRP